MCVNALSCVTFFLLLLLPLLSKFFLSGGQDGGDKIGWKRRYNHFYVWLAKGNKHVETGSMCNKRGDNNNRKMGLSWLVQRSWKNRVVSKDQGESSSVIKAHQKITTSINTLLPTTLCVVCAGERGKKEKIT